MFDNEKIGRVARYLAPGFVTGGAFDQEVTPKLDIGPVWVDKIT
jgi:hypothetical protein